MSTLRTRFPAAVGAGLATAALLVAATAAPASAHVTVSSSDATAGGYGQLSFRVPSEKAKANTVGLTIRFPAQAKVASVRTQPVPGWKSTVATAKDGAQTVTFKATGNGLSPSEFAQFQLLAGPLPKAEKLTLPAVQKYSDGSTVAWSQQASGDTEPERPAPTLELAAGNGTDAHGRSEAAQAAGPDAQNAAVGSAAGGGGVGITLGIVGAVLGLAGLALGAVALRRTRFARGR